MITVEHLSKKYRIGALRRHNSFRDVFDEKLQAIFKPAQRKAAANESTIWALKDVSFGLNEGQVLGIIGRNGAGKSTLLKLLSRITEPTEGTIRMRGRVASLLEIGTGFSPELTGRENIFLNGAILGMRKAEIDRKYDEIVEFSEIGKFIDTPVKRYSSGMFMRLAFAVAAHLEPEDLDRRRGSCRRRCTIPGKMSPQNGRYRKKQGTHRPFCQPQYRSDHEPLHACRAFAPGEDCQFRRDECRRCRIPPFGRGRRSGKSAVGPSFPLPPRKEFSFTKVGLKDQRSKFSSEIDVRFPFTVHLEYRVAALLHNVELSVRFFAYDGRPVFTSHQSDSRPEVLVQRAPGMYAASVTVPGNLLVPGDYFISVEAQVPAVTVLEKYDHIIKFHINETGSKLSRYQPHQYMQGVVIVEFPWNENKIG